MNLGSSTTDEDVLSTKEAAEPERPCIPWMHTSPSGTGPPEESGAPLDLFPSGLLRMTANDPESSWSSTYSTFPRKGPPARSDTNNMPDESPSTGGPKDVIPRHKRSPKPKTDIFSPLRYSIQMRRGKDGAKAKIKHRIHTWNVAKTISNPKDCGLVLKRKNVIPPTVSARIMANSLPAPNIGLGTFPALLA
eukprot:CAMPEP_0178393594 /NCGR_PEP_ID=MMETSP0689_2-20121128/12267_1 /TAXON_ID=160604 /ORGANISM="Amphidinium massartii, Strain CS-259" /LENGTH=191 /DNA_ID=CAMNT_0020014189 /DNA_START=191 /DNA_END=767 /DNA_ORIENTATION=+